MPLLSCKLLIPEPGEKHTGKKVIPTGKTQIHPLVPGLLLQGRQKV